MGYIELVFFVVYIWFLKFLFSCIGLLFDMVFKDFEWVFYFEFYIVIELGFILLVEC